MLVAWDKELSLQAEPNRVNLPGVLQELFPRLGLLLVRSKQVKSHLEEQGILDAAACGLPSDALLI